jgi:hypothetical protein
MYEMWRRVCRGMKQAIIIWHLEQQKCVLCQYLNYYVLMDWKEAIVETKQEIEEVEKRLRRLRANE